MEERVDGQVEATDLALLRAPAHLRDPHRAARERLRREVPERADHLRLDQLDLAHQVGLALLDLLGERVAVPRRTALEDVRDEHLAALDADLLEQLVEEAARATDERLALEVLVAARRLAHEHQVGVRVAHPEDEVRPRGLKRAAMLGVELLVELDQLGAAFLGWAPHEPEYTAIVGRIGGEAPHNRSRLPPPPCVGGGGTRRTKPPQKPQPTRISPGGGGNGRRPPNHPTPPT